jgi:translocation and assembly module TamB
MSRGKKIAAIVAASIGGLILLAVIAGIVIVQTDWFRNTVREKIVAAVEDSTGGKAEIGRFDFDWHHLQADVYDFVIHGLEPAGAAPLFRAKHLQVNLKLTSPFTKIVDIAYLLVDTPQANVIVYPDGHTNIPAPKVQHKSDKTALQTVVDLAIGRFDLRNGSFTFAERKSEFDASGENLRALLDYNSVNPQYSGTLKIQPLQVKSGANVPVDVNVEIPVKLETDKVTVTNARLDTPKSEVVISASMDHLVAPRTSAHVNARVALDEVKRAAGLAMPLDTVHAPDVLNADVTAYMDQNRVDVRSARLTYGHSNIEASGTLKDPQKPAALQFNASLALGEIGRLLKVAAQPEGTVRVGGNATLRPNNDYLVTANVDARNVSVRGGGRRISGIDLDSSVKADPHLVELGGLRLAAFGGSFNGSAALREMDQFRVSGNLRNFDIARVMRVLMPGQSVGYDGVVSGPLQAEGSIKKPTEVVARANLGIAPGRNGIPVSGHLGVNYSGRSGTVTLARSYLNLPHTRVDLSGSLGQQIQVRLVSRDFGDFRPVAPSLPVRLENGGTATINATVSGSLSAPRITGHAAMTNFAVSGRPFSRFTADIAAAKNGASVSNGLLARGPLQAQFSGIVGLRNWKPESNQPLRVDATMRNADLADVLALAGQSDIPATGALSADAHINGTVGSPRGNAALTVANGTIEGEPFDTLNARAVMTDRSIEVPTLQLVAGPSRIDASATYQHAVNDLSRGALLAHVASNQVQLAQFQSLVKDRPGLRGILTLNADAAANIVPAKTGTDVQVTSLNANVAARGLQMEGKNLGNLTATATSAGQYIRYNLNSDFAGSTIRVNGQSLLTGDHDTSANAQIANLPIDRVLAVAGRTDLPVNGILAANAQVSGTLKNPQANGNFTITKGVAYQEPFDRLQATVEYTNQLIDVPEFRVDDGPSYIEASASFAHPANDLQEGQVRFRVRSNDVQLARIHTLQQSKPGLAGVVQLAADGAATLRRNASPLFSTLNARVAARGLSVDKKPLGDLTATAETRGQDLTFNLASDLGRADIRGNGTMRLTGDYPLNAQVTFSNVTYSGLSPLLGGTPQPLEAVADGRVTVSGPVTRTQDLRGSLELSKLQARSVPASTGRQPRVAFELHNAGPIAVALDRNVVTVQSAHIVGPFTDVAVTGTASLGTPNSMNLRANGNIKLELLEAFNPDIFSSGNVVLNAAVTGTTDKPVVNGRLQLQNASFNMLTAPNGLSNGNGTILFNGTEAVIQNITGETGGGKITLAGFVSYGGPEMQFRVQATANRVHVDYPESVTTEASAQLAFAGTTSRSLLSGNVTIEEVALHSHSDIGSILTQAATPPAVQQASTGLLAGIRFDVKIRTAPDVQFRTSLTQNLQADANLTLRGTVDHPGMIGRLAVTRGDVVFFGSKYTIDQGTVTFFDPRKINPILNIDLNTTVQGIDISLSVTGPMDKMKLSYRSDPPMQFSDLVSLLASGRVPTTDPVLAARQPVAPQQTFEQAGASTLLGQAVANPVSGRLQRLFGVSKLKIDPQITGTSNTPQATMTLQQQITRDLTFTYIQDVSQTNPQIIRIEWAINSRWSAIAQRDLNGMFDLDFFYKRRFR